MRRTTDIEGVQAGRRYQQGEDAMVFQEAEHGLSVDLYPAFSNL